MILYGENNECTSCRMHPASTERSGYELDLPSVHYMTPLPTCVTSNQQDEHRSRRYGHNPKTYMHTTVLLTVLRKWMVQGSRDRVGKRLAERNGLVLTI